MKRENPKPNCSFVMMRGGMDMCMCMPMLFAARQRLV